MSRAVHGFQGKQLLFHFKGEHVLAVVLPVARGHPEPAVIDVRGDHLLESSFPVFTLLGKTQCMCREYMLTHQVQGTISRATLYYLVKFKMHILKSPSSAGRYSPKRRPLHMYKRRVLQHNWSHGRKGNDVSVPSKEMGTLWKLYSGLILNR